MWFAADWYGEYYTVRLRCEHATAEKSEFFHADAPEDAFQKAYLYILDLPDPAEEARKSFIARLGRLIDEGRDLGFEPGFLNPLAETMKRLSENAITHQAAE